MTCARPLLLPLVLALLLPAACSSDGDVTPSCLPPGYRPRATAAVPPTAREDVQGEELDVKLAVVEGEVITRRRLVREVGGRVRGQDAAALERQVQRRLMERARLLVFAKEGERAGVTIRDQLLEQVVADELERRRAAAEETIGEPVTVEEYLAERGLTPAEFRNRVKEELLFKAYVVKLQEGIGGPTRPQVDMRASPAEIRRIYWTHPGAFDEKPAVRFAVFQFPVEKYLEDDVGFLDAEEQATEGADALAAAFRKGEDPKGLAQRFDLGEGWKVPKEDEFVEQGGQIRALGEEANDWLFDPQRKPNDATVIPDVEGPVVLGVVEVRPGKRLAWPEAHDKIREMILRVRERRLVEQRLIEILSSRDVVQPAGLAAQMLAEARNTLKQMDEDPVLAAARFR